MPGMWSRTGPEAVTQLLRGSGRADLRPMEEFDDDWRQSIVALAMRETRKHVTNLLPTVTLWDWRFL